MEVNSKIRNFIMSEFKSNTQTQDISNDYSLIDSGVIDSVGIISLLNFLEKSFSVNISSDELMPENFDTINLITYFVEKKINSK
jgi:acyl carrier protein